MLDVSTAQGGLSPVDHQPCDLITIQLCHADADADAAGAGALVMPLMAQGFKMGLIKFVLITGMKPKQ